MNQNKILNTTSGSSPQFQLNTPSPMNSSNDLNQNFKRKISTKKVIESKPKKVISQTSSGRKQQCKLTFAYLEYTNKLRLTRGQCNDRVTNWIKELDYDIALLPEYWIL